MNPCTTPKVSGDRRYCVGRCTWHGPIALTASRKDGTPCCPACNGELREFASKDEFYETVRTNTGDEDMARWSEGRCFPDFDTLVNAYRQAMEGEQ